MSIFLDKCEINLLKRKFTMYGSDGTIKSITADTIEQFDSMYSFVINSLKGTEYLTYSDEI